mgnify:CR=1 FL=1
MEHRDEYQSEAAALTAIAGTLASVPSAADCATAAAVMVMPVDSSALDTACARAARMYSS